MQPLGQPTACPYVCGPLFNGLHFDWAQLNDVFSVFGPSFGGQVPPQSWPYAVACGILFIKRFLADLAPSFCPLFLAHQHMKAVASFREHAVWLMEIGIAP